MDRQALAYQVGKPVVLRMHDHLHRIANVVVPDRVVRSIEVLRKPDANLHKFSFHNLVNQGDLGRSYITSRASNPQK